MSFYSYLWNTPQYILIIDDFEIGLKIMVKLAKNVYNLHFDSE